MTKRMLKEYNPNPMDALTEEDIKITAANTYAGESNRLYLATRICNYTHRVHSWLETVSGGARSTSPSFARNVILSRC